MFTTITTCKHGENIECLPLRLHVHTKENKVYSLRLQVHNSKTQQNSV